MITIKDVEHVAKLARLELTDDEKEKFTKQLGDVLKHVDAMNEVDTSNVEPMAHAIDFVNVVNNTSSVLSTSSSLASLLAARLFLNDS